MTATGAEGDGADVVHAHVVHVEAAVKQPRIQRCGRHCAGDEVDVGDVDDVNFADISSKRDRARDVQARPEDVQMLNLRQGSLGHDGKSCAGAAGLDVLRIEEGEGTDVPASHRLHDNPALDNKRLRGPRGLA